MSGKNHFDVCEQTHVHEQNVREVRSRMPFGKEPEDMAELFKVLGDRTRVRILHALSLRELCVCDLGDILDMTPSAVSHQLRILRAAKLVKYRRQGKNAFYSLDDSHVQTIFEQALEHIRE